MRDLINSSRVGRGVGSGGATMGIDVDVMVKRELRVNKLCNTEIYGTTKKTKIYKQKKYTDK